MEQDWTDRHIAHWRDHAVGVPFEETAESIVARLGRIQRQLREAKQQAAAQVGLQDFEYDTLHALVVREPSGSASPTDLARDLEVTGASMTYRLDHLERSGYIQRSTVAGDRRRSTISITEQGLDRWRAVMQRRGQAEAHLVHVLSQDEQTTLNTLLRKLTLYLEREPPIHRP